MALDSRQISAYCNIAELTFVEMGVCEGVKGFWFSPRDYSKVFVTEDEICTRLDGRTNTLFASAKVPAEAKATAG